MSRIEMIRPSSSQKAIESGISVSFIQNVPTTGSSHTNAMPSYGERLSRPISPVWRSVGVSATWTSSETVPSSVPIDSVANAFGSEAFSADPHATATSSSRGASRIHPSSHGSGEGRGSMVSRYHDPRRVTDRRNKPKEQAGVAQSAEHLH